MNIGPYQIQLLGGPPGRERFSITWRTEGVESAPLVAEMQCTERGASWRGDPYAKPPMRDAQAIEAHLCEIKARSIVFELAPGWDISAISVLLEKYRSFAEKAFGPELGLDPNDPDDAVLMRTYVVTTPSSNKCFLLKELSSHPGVVYAEDNDEVVQCSMAESLGSPPAQSWIWPSRMLPLVVLVVAGGILLWFVSERSK